MNDPLASFAEALALGRLRVVDCSQPLSPATPVIRLPPEFAATPPVRVERLSEYDDAGPAWYWNVLHLGEHTGTHFDAPVHWVTGRELPAASTDTIDPARFIAPACVIDCSEDARRDEDFLLTPARVAAWEREHGPVPAGAWLLMRTDWSRRTDPDAFLNMRDDGAHTPGFSPDAVRLLVEERGVLGLGVETVGTDAGQAHAFDPPFPAHHILHGAGRFGLASLANLDRLPPTGAVLIAAPLKIVHGSGSPVRALAVVPA
ncbi:MAG: cyclase family protein [Planctomycetota bacterium]|nr:MAG: cyclase family protein [Planctomycetota bacterium]